MPTAVLVAYIDQNRERFGVEPICKVLRKAGTQIAPSTYYAAKTRPPSARAVADERHLVVIRRVHKENYGVYGVRKMHAELNRRGHQIARCTVHRLMRADGLRGISRAKGPRTTVPGSGPDTRPDLLDRDFKAPAPNRVWVADITYCRTFAGRVYAAFVIDVISRRVVGWQLSKSLRTDLALDALEMGLWTREHAGQDTTGVIAHSDKGVQGGFNRSSQHLVLEVLSGASSASSRSCDPSEVALAWSSEVPASCRGSVLGEIAKGALPIEAAAVAGVAPAVGQRWFRNCGGMAPFDLTFKPTGRYLSFAEREEIALLRAQDKGVREIARAIGRDPGTVSRELRRNAAVRYGSAGYRASVAQLKADMAAKRPKPAKLAVNPRLRSYVQERLAGQISRPDGSPVPGPLVRSFTGLNKPHRKDRPWTLAWSPEQISQRLKIDFPDDQSMRISHEAIYQSLFIEGRGALKRELVWCLRTGRALRAPRERSRRKTWAHVTPGTLITERPAEAEDRAVPGHWEGDLLIGLERSAIGTVVERTTRFTMLVHLPREEGYRHKETPKNGPALAGYGALTMKNALTNTMSTLPTQLTRSLTWDRGKEMSAHAKFSVETGIPVFFADPQSPWQRGTNENTNGLLRQYFPKGTDLSRWSAEDIEAVAHALNTRPRKTLGWRTSAEAFDEHLRSLQQAGVATTS